MRYISLKDVQVSIPPDWIGRAEKALEAVAKLKLKPEARAKAINARSDVWSELKPKLEKISFGKCWYCESREIRSDKAVDHFRPKNRVAESKNGSGYWWLAFDWSNYRYSCTYCNSRRTSEETAGGKGDRFPLLDETKRGQPQATMDDLRKLEQPKLLDPTDLTDVGLLTFDPKSGAPVVSVDPKKNRIAQARVQESIAAYHLDEEALQKRRFAMMIEVKDRLLQADKMEEDSAEQKVELDYLIRAADPRAEYSAAVRAMLRSLRGLTPLAQRVLDAA